MNFIKFEINLFNWILRLGFHSSNFSASVYLTHIGV